MQALNTQNKRLYSRVLSDLTCIDNTLMHWTKNDQMYNCAEYVAKDPCHCENEHVAENCCASCKGKGKYIINFC